MSDNLKQKLLEFVRIAQHNTTSKAYQALCDLASQQAELLDQCVKYIEYERPPCAHWLYDKLKEAGY